MLCHRFTYWKIQITLRPRHIKPSKGSKTSLTHTWTNTHTPLLSLSPQWRWSHCRERERERVHSTLIHGERKRGESSGGFHTQMYFTFFVISGYLWNVSGSNELLNVWDLRDEPGESVIAERSYTSGPFIIGVIIWGALVWNSIQWDIGQLLDLSLEYTNSICTGKK